MLYKLYQKQVEAWKEDIRFEVEKFEEKFNHGQLCEENEEGCTCLAQEFLRESLTRLSSRHKDTIELIEAEIERKKQMRKDEKAINLTAMMSKEDAKVMMAYNSAIDEDIAYLEEQIKLIQNKQ